MISKRNYFIRICLIAIAILLTTNIKAQHIIIDGTEANEINLSNTIHYFEDKKKISSIHDFMFDTSMYGFSVLPEPGLNPGFTESSFWFQFTIINKTKRTRSLFFVIEYPLVNNIKYYEIENNRITKKVITGDYKIFSSREVPNRNYIFKINLEPGQKKRIFTYTYNNAETVRLPFRLMNESEFYIYDNRDLSAKSVYFGFLFFALILNILLFLSIRDKVYLIFSAYILTLGLFLANIDGLTFQNIFPYSPWLANHGTILFATSSNFFLILFSRTFLEIRKNLRVLYNYTNILLAISVVLFIGAFTLYPIYPIVVAIVNMFTFFNVLSISIIGIFALRTNSHAATTFLISFILLLIGVSIYVLRNAGVLPVNTITQYSIKTGFAIQILLLSYAVSDRFKRIMEDARFRLEAMVKERTSQIEKQKEEIEKQNIHLEGQHLKISNQNDEITSSIRYAQRIQSAMLPTIEASINSLHEHFIIYKPKDIVSGDFYWLTKKKNKTILVVADCTGHGVPGAFMSLLGISFLNEIINNTFENKKNTITASEILDELTTHVIKTLVTQANNERIHDGMDIALCIIDNEKRNLQFAGAHNTICYSESDNSPLHEIKGNNRSIGRNYGNVSPFENHVIHWSPGFQFYLFTDGFHDQFGGAFKKPMRSRHLKKLIEANLNKAMNVQKAILENHLKEWQGAHEQTDDILVIGCKL